MIIKFKIFETKQTQKFWKILTDEYFFIRLDKLGMPEKVQNDIYEHYCDYNENLIKFVMIGKENYGYDTYDWHWDFNQDKKENDFYVGCEYEYQGELELTQDEINDWILKNNAKKYNL